MTENISNLPSTSVESAKKILRSIFNEISNSNGNNLSQGVFLWGPPGVGKSDLVKQLADEKQIELVDIRLPLLDPIELRGLPTVDEENGIARWLPPDFLPKGDSPPGILFLDEINAAAPSIQASAYQLVLDKKIGTYELPKGWVVIAAGNRTNDRSVAYRLPTALANRFTHLEIVPKLDEWTSWGWKNDIDPMIISFLKIHSELLLSFNPKKNDVAFPSPRSWAFVSKLKSLRNEDINLYLSTVAGTIGVSASQQFLAFLNYRDELPNPEDILNGEPYDLPENIDAQYVMMGSLIKSLLTNTDEKRVNGFFNYVAQFEQTKFSDYSVVLVKEAFDAFRQVNRIGDITKHSEFDLWLDRNSSVIL